jgi:hypothetical protein
MINAIAKVLRQEGARAIGFIICFALSMRPVVWTVINEVFLGHAPCLQQSLKANVSFQALLDAPGKFGEGPPWVMNGRSDGFGAVHQSVYM